MRLRPSHLFPVAVFVIGVAVLYGWSLSPLPANGFGRTIYDVHTIVTIPSQSTISILVGNGQEIPAGSLVVITGGVVTDKPGSDIQEDAYIRLEYAGSILEEGLGSGLRLTSFEARQTTMGTDNPQLYVRNDHSYPIEVDHRAFVIRPPTTWEKFSMFLGFVVTASLLATLWPLYLVTIGRSKERQLG